LTRVDDIRFGAAIRAARIRRGWRQEDLAARAGVSASVISRLERGYMDSMQLRTVRKVTGVLEIRVELLPRSRGAEVDRITNARHAELTEAVVDWLRSRPGWEVRPELSFSRFGERGTIDLVAWHEGRHALLECEHKTDVIDSGEILGTLDRRRRLGHEIVAELGWKPATVSSLLIIGDSDANRRRVSDLASTFDAALPDRGVAVRAYLRDPDRGIRGLIFFANRRPGQATNRFAGAHRVRRSESSRSLR
jgi:transcriptional regulator with XRE-family HTH domain